MKRLISFTDKIIAATVPEDAKEIQVTDAILVKFKEPPCLAYFYNGWHKIPLPSGKWEKVGEANSNSINVNADILLELIKLGKKDDNDLIFLSDLLAYVFSFLASHDIYWVNPMREHFIKKPNTIDAINMDLTEYELGILRLDWDKKESNAEEMKGKKIVICAKID